MNVIYYYENELGITYNPSKVFVWTEKLANIGDHSALAKLSYYYEYGVGTEINPEKSKEFYVKAIELCNAKELFGIGEDFTRSKHYQEQKQAHKWFSLAFSKAEELDVDFLEDMGLSFKCLIKIDNNIEMAIKCYELASQKGSKEAIENIKCLNSRLEKTNDENTRLIMNEEI